MPYITLRGRWCDIIVLNVHAPTEDKMDDMKDSYYKELECVFDILFKYNLIILVGDFNAKVSREDNFKPTTGNESLHVISNDNRVRAAKFATSKDPTAKSKMFLHCNNHKFTWICPNGKTQNQIYHILIDRRRHSRILDIHRPGHKIVILTII
jgi:exonuclease III